MEQCNLISVYQKQHFKPAKTHCNEANIRNVLNRQFDSDIAYQKVVSDLTYVRVNNDWNYICLLVDLYNREIIGYSVGIHKDADLVYRAFVTVPTDLSNIKLFHTDRGSEFDNELIDNVINTFHITRSLSHKGTPYDNAVAESTFKIFKTEFIYQNTFSSLNELKTKLADYIHWFNTKRIHSTLDYLSPLDYKTKQQQIQQQQPQAT